MTISRALPVVLLLLSGGCVMNDAYELRDSGSASRSDRAIIVFGASDDRYAPEQKEVAIQFDHYSLETGSITGNCFNYDRLEVERPTATGAMEYFAFSAPPGHYVISPFSGRSVDEGASMAFLAPAGEVTYFGDFTETGGDDFYWSGRISRTLDTVAAAAFAESRRLSAPRPAATTPISDRGPIFVCTP